MERAELCCAWLLRTEETDSMMLKKGKKRDSSTPGICSQTLTAGILNRALLGT